MKVMVVGDKLPILLLVSLRTQQLSGQFNQAVLTWESFPPGWEPHS